MTASAGKLLFSCAYCDYSSPISFNRDRHVALVHDKEKPFKCAECDYATGCKENLEVHVWRVHEKRQLGAEAHAMHEGQTSDIRQHADDKADAGVVQASDNKPQEGSAQQMPKGVEVPSGENLQDGKKRAVCKLCGKQMRAKSIKSHIAAVHEKKKSFECSECVYASASAHSLKMHVASVHLKEKRFKCDRCDYGTPVNAELRRHVLAKHTEDKPFKCPQCEYSTGRKSCLTTHIRTVHEKKLAFKCDRCEYSTTTQGALKRHAYTHESVKPHKCPHCEFSTVKLRELESHLAHHHTGERKHVCDVCSKGFAIEKFLKTHKKIHDETKWRKCEFCDYSTASRSNLETHMFRHHKESREMRQKPSKKDVQRRLKSKQNKRKQVYPALSVPGTQPTEAVSSALPKSEEMDVDALADAINNAVKQEVKDEPSAY